VGLHITVSKALNKFKRKALVEMYREIRQIDAKKVWHPRAIESLTRKQLKKVIRSSLFIKEKFTSTGAFEKLKARLVAGGHMQDKSIYDDVSSPTVSTAATFLVAAIAAQEHRHVATLDIGGAYLNASMKEHEVLMRLDPKLAMILTKIRPDYKPFLDADGTMVVQLDKALYGCVESARLWYDHLRKTLEAMGFQANPHDICTFNKGSVQAGDQCTIILHVDDLMVTSKQQAVVDKVVADIVAVYKEVTVNRGAVHSYLGMTFDFTVPGQVKVSQEGYVQDLIKAYDVTGRAQSPAGDNLFAVNEDAEKLSKSETEAFHSKTAKLLYLSKRTRPDILTAVVFLTTRVLNPDVDDARKLDRVLKYVNATQELALTLQPEARINVTSYIDASYGVHPNGRSHTGSVITLGKGAVHAKSTKQKLVSKSSTESELVALSDEASQVLWTRNFLELQGYSMRPAKIYQDNMSTIALADKGRSTSERTRHINVRYFFTKDKVESGELVIEYLPTEEMLADLLTKPLQGALFRRLRNQLLNCSN
jgi:hypothetical protein